MEEYYDHIEVSDAASLAHYKRAYIIRNREMVDRSDLVIAYVNRKSGGAFQTLDYAKKVGKEVINLSVND